MIYVKNVDVAGDDSLARMGNCLQSAVIKGLMNNLTMEEKRGAFSNESGYTDNNAHEYSNCRLNGLKTTGPSLTTTFFDGLGEECQDFLTDAILLGLRQCPKETCMRAFPNTKDNDNEYDTFDDTHGARKELVSLLMDHFRMDTTDEECSEWCFEMASVRLGLTTPLHFDGINDPASDISVQLKIHIPIRLLPKKQQEHAIELGYVEKVPAQVLIYSRAHVKRAAEKINGMRRFMTPVVNRKDPLSSGMAKLKNIVGELILHKGERCYQAHLDGNEKLTGQDVKNHSRVFLDSQSNLHKLIADPDASAFANVVAKNIVFSTNKKTSPPVRFNRAFDSVLSKQFTDLFNKTNKTLLLTQIQESYLAWKDIPVKEIMNTIESFLVSEKKIIPDPNVTYHGPIIEYLASFDKTRYYSEFLDCWYDIVVNDFVVRGKQVSAKEAIGFILFCAGNCNGQSGIAELTRIRTMDKEMSFSSVMEEYQMSLYDCLFNMGGMTSWTTCGSCTMNRHQFTNPGKQFEFEDVYNYVEPILKNLRSHEGKATLGGRTLNTFVKLIGGTVREKEGTSERLQAASYPGIKGIGSVTAHTFIHLSSLLGIIPLGCYREATLSHDVSIKCGPSRFISKCTGITNSKEINEIFGNMHKELEAILGDMITKNYLENLLCEANRIFEYAESKLGSGKSFDVSHKSADELKDFMFSHNLMGNYKDGIFIHRERGPNHCIQNMFAYDGSSPPTLTMHSTQWNEGNKTLATSKKFFSKFRCNTRYSQTDIKSNPPMAYWIWDHNDGILVVDKSLEEEYSFQK